MIDGKVSKLFIFSFCDRQKILYVWESIGLVLFMVFSAGKVVEKYLYSIVHIAVCIGLLN